MKFVDAFLDRITMYRLVVYVLGTLSGLAVLFSLFGKLPYSATSLIVSLGLILVPALIVDKGLGRIFRAPTNSESWLITSLIIFLIVHPATSVAAGLALVLAGVVSSASKFFIVWNSKHIFNPAAFAAAVLSLTALQSTTWWIGNSVFWPFTLVLGVTIVRKIRRLPLFVTFVGISTMLQIILFVVHHQPLAVGLKGSLIASPLLFLSTIMLTEPATMPPRRTQQILFAAIVAVLYVTAWEFGPLVVYPEVALLLGNLYAFAVSPKFRVRMTLTKIQKISDSVYNYVFQPDKRFNFLPGQYMEWTLAGVPYDSRGNRRSLTIASSPTEEEIHVGLKYHLPASTYKTTFFNLKPGDAVYASQLAGNFTVDQAAKQKLAFIAGGIGITPFRSMVKYFTDNQLTKDIVLIYVIPDVEELAYNKEFLAARQYGLKIIPVVTKTPNTRAGVVHAKFNQELLVRLLPDYSERMFYISGPSTMVDATKTYLHNLHVERKMIKTDHFTGY